MFYGTSRGYADEEVFGKVYNQRVVTRVVPYMRSRKAMVVIAIGAVLIFTGTQLAVPWLIGVGIDKFIIEKNFSGLTWLFALFIGLTVINWGSNFAQQVAIARIGQSILYGLRRDMFVHLQKLGLSFHDRTEVGRIISRVQGDVGQLQEFMSLVTMTFGDMLVLAGIVVALMAMSFKLGVISMSVLPLLVIIMVLWQPSARKAFMRVRVAISVVNGTLNENITGIRTVQSMNRENRNTEIFDGNNREHLAANLVANKLSAALLPSVDILTSVSIGLAVVFGSRMIVSEELTIGVLVAFVMYIQRFFDPIRNLTIQYTDLQRAMASGVRIFDLLDTELELMDAPGAKLMPRLKGQIELQNVSYNYVAGEDVLNKINLRIDSGKTVAIVGPSGAGKTTLVSLIARFYDVPRGRGTIMVDGKDIREVTRNSLVSQMSMVLQEPFVFSGTVRENIKYNNKDMSDTQMIDAAKAVGAHDFIVRLRDGYDSFLQERGGNLSVGQRQLLSFARAIITDPRVLILDEATANIDSHTEMLVQRALRRVLKGRTAIVIAHRLSTIRGADKIVVVNSGELVEEGTHDQLMGRDGLYMHLYHMNYAAIEAPLVSDKS